MIWNEAKECISRDELHHLQSKRLVKQVDNVYHNVEYYRKKMQAMGVEPGDIETVEDIVKESEWNESKITARTKKISDLFEKIWPIPQIN